MLDPVLVIAHEATRTGSPVVLRDLLRLARPNMKRPLSVRLLSRGPLSDDLMSLGEVPAVGTRPGAVLVNSALAAHALADYPGVPAAVYVHEEGEALLTLDEATVEALTRRATLVIGVSPAACADLAALGVETSRIRQLPPIVTLKVVGEEAADTTRHEFAGPGARIVAGCGVAGWRKGTDLFVDTVARITRTHRISPVWIGRRSRSVARLLDADCASLGIDVTWAGELDDPRALLAAADVLVMPSREDPQPLVPLEAALLSTASVGFSVGGIQELHNDGAAVAVPYPDTSMLAAAAARLLDRTEEAEMLTSRARDRIARRHAPDVVVPDFLAILDELYA